ncbi:MAG: DUF5107 domain-containing protein [Clostridia bacterium]|nr:DUF5107 domain-containing protein [Clostridia bacterium]
MKMNRSTITVETLVLPTYLEPDAEELPMFAENRVHQRSSGDPYPNKIVSATDRVNRVDREYIAVRLENDYISVVVLPEIGGRVYSAYDKTTGYDFFYKQHVIKPALIGVLGSWISGGVEFNWPFHHRASGFMPCDYTVEEYPDGSVACHLSEHDPIDRMKGMVSIVLTPDAKYFETRMRLYNRTDTARSFLWWENAAVPVDETYQIFFPEDVTYVNFHYLKSRISFPVAANGVFNGIPMYEPRDISWHKNTKEATSYFASASDYDFFGGYDHGKGCGVVHIGDHHISPGKKMFTWAYGQLSKSWENALTDTDGQYAELMAGSYSDNQPNFSWLAPYETKEFSQYWYPISDIGAPTFANLNCAFRVSREGSKPSLLLQTCKVYENASVKVYCGEKVYLDTTLTLTPDKCARFELDSLPEHVSVSVTACDGRAVAEYTEKKYDTHKVPEPITDMPIADGMSSAQDLYLAGVHVDQYRDPAVKPDAYWLRALERDRAHIPSLIAMAGFELDNARNDSARSYAERAIRELTAYNTRTQSGEAYYVYARILEADENYKEAYDYYYKAAYCADSVGKAMTRIALLDIRKKDYPEAIRHATWALDYGRRNSLANAVLSLALKEDGRIAEAKAVADATLAADPLDHLTRFISGCEDFYSLLMSNPTQTCLDLATDLDAMGRYADAVRLLEGLKAERPESADKMVHYALAYFKNKLSLDGTADVENALKTPLGAAYPSRLIEIKMLNLQDTEEARMLLGCILYHKRQYERAARLFESSGSCYIARRNLAVAYFSHLNRKGEALEIMKALMNERPDDGELLYETVVLMSKMGIAPAERIALIKKHNGTREDILVELAKAYNQNGEYDEALSTLLSRDFVPCEGGEHAIADQYMYAYLCKAIAQMKLGRYAEALELCKRGQVLPQSLGAGIWNHCKLIPLRYREALCLEALGRVDEANEIYRYISSTEIEYFSNMHLPELPYYQALSYDKLGESFKSQALMTRYIRIWGGIENVKDNGFFATTPFFMPFIEEPERLRHAKALYLGGLIDRYLGNDAEADRKLCESYRSNSDNLFARIM